MTDEPTLAELNRRVNDLRNETRASFAALGERLDKMPTSDLLALSLSSHQMQVDLVRAEIGRVERSASARADMLEADQKKFEDRLESNRKWTVATGLTALAVLIGLAGFVLSVVQA